LSAGVVARTRVVFCGEDPRDPLQIAAADYLKRAGKKLDAALLALPPARRAASANDDAVRLDEATRLLSTSDGCTRVALDPTGKLHDSSSVFAVELERLMARGKPLAFLIGGATGHHRILLHRAEARWSLSRLTFAHRLAVCVLAEQLYRASEIWRGGPYHK
jgi:23S rRNA (pseudouridine1915-N3)-methyltransferase